MFLQSDLSRKRTSPWWIHTDASIPLSHLLVRPFDLLFVYIHLLAVILGIVENYSAFEWVAGWSTDTLSPTINISSRSYPFDRIKRLYDINVHGAFFTAREAARNMIPQGGGSIVLVASMSANVCILSLHIDGFVDWCVSLPRLLISLRFAILRMNNFRDNNLIFYSDFSHKPRITLLKLVSLTPCLVDFCC